MIKKNRMRRTGKLKQFMSCALVAIVATTLLLPVNLSSAYATPTSAEKQAEADQVSAQLAVAETEMLQMRDEYMRAVQEHDAAIAAMEEAQQRIDAAEAIIKETQLKLGNRANQMYRQGALSYLDVLFGASSFEEFTTSLDMINAINQENATLIQANKDARTEAEAAHAEYSVQETAAAEREAEAEAVKVKAEEAVAAEGELLASLEAEVAELVEQETIARLAAEAAAAEQAAQNTPSGGGGGTTPNTGYNPGPAPAGGDVVAMAASRLGCPYIWGASGPNSFDCSGLTSWCYLQAGRGWIGRTDRDQKNNASATWPYANGGASPGDVLWWTGHVAIYVGGGTYIEAPMPGMTVQYSSWNINNATVLRF